jgi:hypothetical protein
MPNMVRKERSRFAQIAASTDRKMSPKLCTGGYTKENSSRFPGKVPRTKSAPRENLLRVRSGLLVGDIAKRSHLLDLLRDPLATRGFKRGERDADGTVVSRLPTHMTLPGQRDPLAASFRTSVTPSMIGMRMSVISTSTCVDSRMARAS